VEDYLNLNAFLILHINMTYYGTSCSPTTFIAAKYPSRVDYREYPRIGMLCRMIRLE